MCKSKEDWLNLFDLFVLHIWSKLSYNLVDRYNEASLISTIWLYYKLKSITLKGFLRCLKNNFNFFLFKLIVNFLPIRCWVLWGVNGEEVNFPPQTFLLQSLTTDFYGRRFVKTFLLKLFVMYSGLLCSTFCHLFIFINLCCNTKFIYIEVATCIIYIDNHFIVKNYS